MEYDFFVIKIFTEDGERYVFSKRMCLFGSEFAKKFTTKYYAKNYLKKTYFSKYKFEVEKFEMPQDYKDRNCVLI